MKMNSRILEISTKEEQRDREQREQQLCVARKKQ